MLPALPIANLVSENLATLAPLVQLRMQLGHDLELSRMLQEVIFQTTSAITEEQIKAVVMLTKQTHDTIAGTLQHYMAEQSKYHDIVRSSTDPMTRSEMTRHITNIDLQMRRTRHALEGLQRFSSKMIFRCGGAGLQFAHDVAIRIK